MYWARIIAVATVCAMSTGCLPATYVQVPAIRGRVLDAAGQPLNDAIVNIEYRQNSSIVGLSKAPIATLRTSSDGTFHRPEDSRFAILIPGLDPLYLRYSVTAVVGNKRSSPKEIHNGFRVWLLEWPHANELGDMQVP